MAKQIYTRITQLLTSCVVFLVFGPVYACTGAENIQSLGHVEVSFDEYAYLSSLPPLRVLSVNVPPLADYYDKTNTYRGISADILCYISQKTGLRYEYIIEDSPIVDKIEQVQNGQADMFMPLSYTVPRSAKGLFSKSYYDSYYSVLALANNPFSITSLNDLKDYKIGMVGSLSVQSALFELVPKDKIKLYSRSDGHNGLFASLRRGEIDLALYNKDFFNEKRFRMELFDIEPIFTMISYPRKYRYYFHDSPKNRQILIVFNRILSNIDISKSIQKHKFGEEQLIERYVKQRSQRSLLQAGSMLIGLLAVIFAVALFKYMRLIKRLEASNRQILEQQRDLERLSLTDTLTGLYNRRMFDQVIVKEHARLERNPTPLSLLMVDIDDFKNINDTFGHVVGDEYLQAIAGVLLQTVKRKTDLVARFGGEEFICVLPDTNLSAATKLAERARKAVIDLNLANPGTRFPYLTVSIGVACLESYDYPIKSFINAVDTQLYIAKRGGKNQVSSIQL